MAWPAKHTYVDTRMLLTCIFHVHDDLSRYIEAALHRWAVTEQHHVCCVRIRLNNLAPVFFILLLQTSFVGVCNNNGFYFVRVHQEPLTSLLFFTEPQKCWWCALIQQCAFRKSPKICISCPVEGADKFIHWLQNPSFNKCRIVKNKRGKSLTNEQRDGDISELSATSCRLRLHPQDIMITTAEPLRLWLLDILTEMLKNMIEGTGRTFIRKPVTAVGSVI